MSLYGKLQPTEQCGAWAALLLESPGFCVLAGRGSAPGFPAPLVPGWGRWCQLSAPCACCSWCAPVQHGIAGLPQIPFLLWDRQNCPSYSRSLPRLLKVFSLLTLHLTLPSLASPFSSLAFLPPSAFQASYSKPPSLKSIVKANPARQQPTAPVRALCRPVSPVSSFLLTKIPLLLYFKMCFENMNSARSYIKKRTQKIWSCSSPALGRQQLISQAGSKLCSKRKSLSFNPYQPLQPF